MSGSGPAYAKGYIAGPYGLEGDFIYDLYEGQIGLYNTGAPPISLTGKRDPRYEAKHKIQSYMLWGGPKLKINRLLTLSGALGLGLSIREAYHELSYTGTDNTGSSVNVKHSKSSSGGGVASGAQLNVIIANFAFMSLAAEGHLHVFYSSFGLARVSVGLRLPLESFSSTIRSLSGM